MIRNKKGWILACAVLLSIFLTAGCGKKVSDGAGAVDKEYTKGQMALVVITERNRYQNLYTSQLWEVAADAKGSTFREKLLEQAEDFLIQLATADLMAQERGIGLSGQEKDSVKKLSQEYWDSLSQEDKDFLNVTQEEVYDLYCDYYLADKLAAELTKGMDLEVSDAEAKVIRTRIIRLSSKEEAERVLELAQKENADFGALASKYSEDSQTERIFEWRQGLTGIEGVAFELEEGQVSRILEEDGSYYLLKCISAYDEEATQARKLKLAQEKKTKAFQEIYGPFVREHTVRLKDPIGDSVEFSGGADCTADHFFRLYHEYFSR